MTLIVSDPTLSGDVRYALDSDETSVSWKGEEMRIGTVKVRRNGGIPSVVDVVAHCVSVDGVAPLDDAPLKWCNVETYARPMPGDFETRLGLFEIHQDGGVYLHSFSDTFPRKPLFTGPGTHTLQFRLDSNDHSITFGVTVTTVDSMVTLNP